MTLRRKVGKYVKYFVLLCATTYLAISVITTEHNKLTEVKSQKNERHNFQFKDYTLTKESGLPELMPATFLTTFERAQVIE